LVNGTVQVVWTKVVPIDSNAWCRLIAVSGVSVEVSVIASGSWQFDRDRDFDSEMQRLIDTIPSEYNIC
jgi:hypothetical protein